MFALGPLAVVTRFQILLQTVQVGSGLFENRRWTIHWLLLCLILGPCPFTM